MYKVYNVIKELAEKQKISIRRLEENLGFGNGTLNRWRTNTPGVDKLEKVADYFGVTTDYLLGRTENNTFNVLPIFQRIQDLAAKRNKNLKGISLELGFSKNYLYTLKTQVPSVDKLQKLAEYFGVTTDYLIQGETKEISISNVSKITYKGRVLSKEDLEMIQNLLDWKYNLG